MPRRIALQKKKVRGRTFIRQWREFRGLSQEKLGELIGTTGTSISRIENGEQPYTQDTLEAIARVLKTDVESLLRRDPTHPETIWPLWDIANEAQRGMIVDIAKTIIGKTET